MTLASATRLGPYEILGLLGRGGMGEVYRARDDRLGREVAVKVLPPGVSADPDRLRRFEQEARAAGALNHPNLVAVFDAGRHEGSPYLVFELLEGQSLRDRLGAHGLPVRKAVDFAVQVANGLATAHEAGIVHRDLKPENLFVTADGRVKILDFGLAKLRPTLDPDAAHGDAETASRTAAGTVMGTVGYMSPEQVQAQPVDHRSDIFSFGGVLYEMLSGRRAFQRETAAETMTAILREEPPELPADSVPPGLERVVRRCLEKRREERFQSARDLSFALDALSTGGRSASAVAPGGALAFSRLLRSRLPRAAWVLAAAAVGFLGHTLLESSATDLASYRFTPLATDAGYEGAASWSPDGNTLTYLGEADGILQVFTRSLASSMSARITQTARDCKDPFWSKDGTRIFYVSPAGNAEGLWAVGAAGGSPQVVLKNVSAAALSPDGNTLALLREDNDQANFLSLWTSSPPGAEPVRYAQTPLGEKRFATGFLRYAPDGSKIGLWAAATSNEAQKEKGYANPEFWIVPLPSGEPRAALQSVSGLPDPAPFSWMPDSRRIVFGAEFPGGASGRHLWIADTKDGAPQPLTATSGSEQYPAISPDGRKIVFTAHEEDYDLVEASTEGSPFHTVLSTSRTEADPVWSPLGSQYAYVTDRTGHPEIWLRSRDGSLERPLVTRASFPSGPTFLLGSLAFSPDGQRIAYQRRGPTGFRVWISAAAGGPAVQLAADESYQDWPTWSPDGNWIAFTTWTEGRRGLAKARVGSGESPVLIKEGIVYPSSPRWSPRGDWITCETPEGFSLVSPDGRTTRVLTEETWLAHAWSKDGSMLYAAGPTDDLRLRLVTIDVASARIRVVSGDLGPSPPTTDPLKGFSLAPDGRSVLTSVLRLRGDLWLLEGFDRPRGFLARLLSRRES
ncbi:MAG: protein kinase [Acidimicrobiales bacterium]